MVLLFELARPFQVKPKVYHTDAVFRVVWLFFGVAFIKIPIRELFIRERIGKYVSEGKVYVLANEELKNFNPRRKQN